MCLQSEEKQSWFFLLCKMFNWLNIMFPAICVVFCIFTYWGSCQTEEAGSHPHFPGLRAHVYQPVSDTSSHLSLVTLDMGDRLRRLVASPRCAQQPGRTSLERTRSDCLAVGLPLEPCYSSLQVYLQRQRKQWPRSEPRTPPSPPNFLDSSKQYSDKTTDT